MQLAVVGLNHNTASVELRECLAVPQERIEQIYSNILKNERIYEALILSTCNRVEYYIVTDDFLCNVESVLKIVAEESKIQLDELKNHTYTYCGRDAIKHLFKVACGLDSLVLGEPQIFGQVKDAFANAKIYGKVDRFLKKLEESTIKIAKKVRTDTKIAENPVSVSYAAVELAKKIFGSLKNKSALIIGAGEMCELAAKHLSTTDISSIVITNRTFQKAEALAKEVSGVAKPFSNINEYLVDADIIISSTGAPDYIVRYDDVKSIMQKRKYSPMFFIDIAVPRDIDPKINEIENTYVYDIDDLKSVVEANKKAREKEAVKAMEMVEEAVDSFFDWVKSLKIVPTIKNLRLYFEEIKNNELIRLKEKHKSMDETLLNYALTSYLNKVLHTPLTNLKNLGAGSEKYTLAEAVEILFNLKGE
ncbi:glutamyl-tRNA reductase [Deferribacterales bacterium Es71-Z0220]|jgi:glutamyl-tRNA reductase|uniref:glutamyl-tRNA reductase n=1 Tax=Deferrivibrio essentukiensis TaxID=2880922 RepID=UPI001F60F019|nr:glutamyl-tRNA reductase [Deferrivibrio essentukiensis]MCB4205486.1 glutamyl-tRNA reductase [Deferrivibrio essentukiensis]